MKSTSPSSLREISSSEKSQLKNFIESIESLKETKAEIQKEIRDLFAEAKKEGFAPKIMKQVLKVRKMKHEEYVEQETLFETYLQELGLRTQS